jgi:hypothetical protein
MPEGIFSQKYRRATDRGLANILFDDVVKQLRRSATPALVDAANCKDRAVHAISSLVFQPFGTPIMRGEED